MNKNLNVTDYIMLLISNNGNKIYGRTYLQKFFFLLKKEFLPEIDLTYTKYHYGPFSMDVVNNANFLVNDNIIIEKSEKFKHGQEGHFYELTEKGIKKVEEIEKRADKKQLEKFKEFCKKYEDYTPSELLKLVYLKYPEWAINSKLMHE